MRRGSLLLLLLLLLGFTLILLCGGFLNGCRSRFFSLGFFLDCNKESDNILGLDHVVFINFKFTEDVIDFSFVHLVSPGGQSVLEHLNIHLSVLIVGLESLEDKIIGIVSITSHLLLEHLHHVVKVAGTA